MLIAGSGFAASAGVAAKTNITAAASPALHARATWFPQQVSCGPGYMIVCPIGLHVLALHLLVRKR
jgi:hypothetical protein